MYGPSVQYGERTGVAPEERVGREPRLVPVPVRTHSRGMIGGRVVLLGLLSVASTGVWASQTDAGDAAVGATALAARFQALGTEPGLGGLPLHARIEEHKGLVGGEFHAVIEGRFQDVATTLRHGAEWCEIASLHLNIKACTHEPRGDLTRLTFYTGTKYYLSPQLSRAYVYDLRVETQETGYLALGLLPDAERRATGAYPLVVELIAVGKNRSFLRVHYRQQLATWARLAADGYFATFGRSKVGFSVTGTDREGRPVYTRDLAGAIERNAVRYYLAVQAYLESLDSPPDKRIEQRRNRWFDLTERYSLQLREIDMAAYLENKKKERQQQTLLQQELDRRHASTPAISGR